MSQGHIAPKSLYYSIFFALLVGTGLTTAIAFVDLGVYSNVVMIGIAMAKASLVILFFMHVRWGTRLTWVVVTSGFFWLLILFTFTMADIVSRGWVAGSPR